MTNNEALISIARLANASAIFPASNPRASRIPCRWVITANGAPTWKAGQEGLPESQVPRIGYNEVGPDYFGRWEYRYSVEGRTIEDQDQSRSPSRSRHQRGDGARILARTGSRRQHLRLRKQMGAESEVVGVVRDSKIHILSPRIRNAYFFVPLFAELHPRFGCCKYARELFLPERSSRVIEDQIHSIDLNLPRCSRS